MDLRQRVAAAREGFARLTAARGALQASLQAPLVDLANHAYDTALATNKTFKDKLNVGFCFFFLLSRWWAYGVVFVQLLPPICFLWAPAARKLECA